MKRIMACLAITAAAGAMAQQAPKAAAPAKAKATATAAAPPAAVAPSAGADHGIFADRIVVGRTATHTGTSARQGTAISAGLKAYLAQVNAAGGVNGRKIELIEIDDNYKADRAAANTKKLIEEYKVFAMLTSHGTGPSRGVVKIIDAAKVPMIGTTSGSVQRDPKEVPSRYFFNVRNSNYVDVKGITTFLKDIGDKSVSAIYSDDAFGKAVMADLERAAKEDGVLLVAKVPMVAEATVADEVVKKLIAEGGGKSQNVIIAMVDKPAGIAIKSLQATNLNKRIFGISSTGEVEREVGKKAAENVVISQTTPPMRDASHPGISRFRTAMAANKATVEYLDSAVAFQGWLTGAVLVAGLNDAGRDVSREKLVDALEKFSNRQLEGMLFDYSTPLHEGVRFQELYMWGAEGRIIY